MALALSLAVVAAQAEKGDRLQITNITFDRFETDLGTNRTAFDGNVVLTQGSMLLRAEHTDIAQSADGYYQAFATGTSSKQAAYRQARDAAGQSVEATANRIEYDARMERVRLVGNVNIRQLNGVLVTREFRGAEFTYDQRTELVSASPSTASERSRVILFPSAASVARPAGSAETAVGLQPVPTLQLHARNPSSAPSSASNR